MPNAFDKYTVPKDEEKAEVLNAFAPAFNSKTYCSLSAQTFELDNMKGTQNEDPIIHEVSGLLHHWDTHMSMDPPKGTEKAGRKWSPSHLPSFTSNPS